MSDRKPLPTAETCETCRFWRDDGQHVGLCRRYPPVLLRHTPVLDAREAFGTQLEYGSFHGKPHEYDTQLSDAELGVMGWNQPATCAEDWCGEYKPANVVEPKANYRESQFLFSRVVDLPIGYGDRESKKLAQAIAEYYNSQPFAPGNLRPETLTVGELLHLSAKSLSKIKGVGEQTVQDLRAVLALHGYFLRGDYPTVADPAPPVG